MKNEGLSTRIKRSLSLLAFASFHRRGNQIKDAVIKGSKFFDSASGDYVPINGATCYQRPNAGELSAS